MSSAQENRRNDLRSADDVQARETRRRLVAAYRDAVAERQPRPSVTWVCARSGVARSTFYTHFATVDDLAVSSITENFATVSEDDVERRTNHTWERRAIARAGLTRVVESLEATRAELEYAIGIGSRAAVLERLVAQFAAFTRRTVAAEYDELDGESVELVAHFVSAGTVHAVLHWMEQGLLPRETLIDRLVDALPAPLTR